MVAREEKAGACDDALARMVASERADALDVCVALMKRCGATPTVECAILVLALRRIDMARAIFRLCPARARDAFAAALGNKTDRKQQHPCDVFVRETLFALLPEWRSGR